MKTTIMLMIEQWLVNSSYDGLYNEKKKCACSLERGIFPFIDAKDKKKRCRIDACVPAHRTACDCGKDCEYHLNKADQDQPLISDLH